MIGMVCGIIEIKDAPYVLVDVSGVGYKVTVPPNLFSTLVLGENFKLFTYTHVREDILDLYGFADILDLKLFEYLISVSGVGPKTASGIFAFGGRIEIIKAISVGDVTFFTKVPRLGKKNAQKIIIELKNKFGEGKDLDLSENVSEELDEVILALKTFGFSTGEAMEAVKKIDKDLSSEEKIKLALKNLGK